MSQKNNSSSSASPDSQDHYVKPCLSKCPTTAIESEISIYLPRRENTNKQILHVEPNADCRFLVSTLLQLDSYVVTSACTVEEAKKIIKSKPFDAYVLDNAPFDQSGIDLCRYICGLDRNAQVIFYSGAAYTSNIKQGLKAGAKEYLTKPLGIENLTDTVARLIHNRKFHKAL